MDGVEKKGTMEEINGTVMELRLRWSGAVISEFKQQDGSGKRVAK